MQEHWQTRLLRQIQLPFKVSDTMHITQTRHNFNYHTCSQKLNRKYKQRYNCYKIFEKKTKHNTQNIK